MRSIRLSLLLYFLVLVSASLGVASILVYSIAQRTLHDKEEAAAKLIEARYEERRREAADRLNDRLLNHAMALAGRVRPRAGWDRLLRGVYLPQVLGVLTAAATPNGHALAPLWCLEGAPIRPPQLNRGLLFSAAQFHIWKHDLIDLRLGKDVVLPDEVDGPRIVALLQTNNWGRTLATGGEGTGVRLRDEANFAPRERLTWGFDDYVQDDGVPVRRVRFRSLLTLQDNPGPPRGPGGVSPYQYPAAALIIQCAANARDLEKSLEDARDQRDDELATLRWETAAALAHQRNWLFVISGFTFAATVLGCVGLVWLGLSPLRRLSDAVGRVSPKNFTLGLGDHPLPTELQPIAETLTTTLDQLRRAFAREKQATADISHELRTPLAALITTIELALRKQRSAEQYREMLEESHLSAKQMHQIVERLLTLARLDAGVDRLRPQSVDVAELAEQCATVVRPLAEAKGLQLAVHNACPIAAATADAAPLLTTDPDKLREVINNLLHNAIQYNRPDGRIDLVVGRDEGHVQVEVRDTGIGIAPESRERIFERFYRADPSRTTDGMNAGLGLAIVKEYIELMGGHITVDSAVGRGTTFRIELPRQAPASAA